MTKKLLTCLFAFCAISFATYAQDDITGTYTGTLDVTVHITGEPEKADPITSSILLSKEENSATYTLSIKDFYFDETPVGDLNVSGITKEEDSGYIALIKTDYSTVDIPGLMIVYIYLDGGYIEGNGKLEELALSVFSAPKGEVSSMLVAEVLFSGDKQTSGLFNPKNSSLAIQVSSDFNTISTLEQNGAYAIFSTTGAVVQSGNIESGIIRISDLKTGIYLVKVNDNIAKFIKK